MNFLYIRKHSECHQYHTVALTSRPQGNYPPYPALARLQANLPTGQCCGNEHKAWPLCFLCFWQLIIPKTIEGSQQICHIGQGGRDAENAECQKIAKNQFCRLLAKHPHSHPYRSEFLLENNMDHGGHAANRSFLLSPWAC